MSNANTDWYYTVATNATAPIGLIAALSVISCFILAYSMDPKLVDRLSLRLMFSIAISDVFNHVSSLIVTNLNHIEDHCSTLSYVTLTCYTLYSFTNISVAFILQRVIIHKRHINRSMEKYIWLFVLGCTIVITMVMRWNKTLGSLSQKSCYLISFKEHRNVILLFALVHSFQILCIIYCTFIVIFIHFKLHQRLQGVLQMFDEHTQQDKDLADQVQRFIRSSLLFPIAPFFTLPGTLAVSLWNTLNDPNKLPDSFVVWKYGTQGLCGVFTLIAFVFDPSFQNILKTARYRLMIYTKGDVERPQTLNYDPFAMGSNSPLSATLTMDIMQTQPDENGRRPSFLRKPTDLM